MVIISTINESENLESANKFCLILVYQQQCCRLLYLCPCVSSTKLNRNLSDSHGSSSFQGKHSLLPECFHYRLALLLLLLKFWILTQSSAYAKQSELCTPQSLYPLSQINTFYDANNVYS